MGTEVSAEPVLNRELVEKVIKHIDEEPRRLEMSTWLQFYPKGLEVEYDLPPCGIVGCIAGTAVLIHDKVDQLHRGQIFVATRAIEVLGLSPEQVVTVFYVTSWPTRFIEMYEMAQSKRERADATIARLRYLLETGM